MVKKLQFALNAKSSSASGMVLFTEENEVTLEAHINGLTGVMQSMCTKKDCSSKMENLVEDIEPLLLLVLGSKTGFHRGDIKNFNADETGHGMITFQLICVLTVMIIRKT